MQQSKFFQVVFFIAIFSLIFICFYGSEDFLYPGVRFSTDFKEFLIPNGIKPRLFHFNGNGWLEQTDPEDKDSEVTYNQKLIKILSLRPEIIVEADIDTDNLAGDENNFNSTFFLDFAGSLEFDNSTSFGISYKSHREEINFANPYSVFGGSRFYHPAGIPEHYTESHPVHYPQLVLVNSERRIRVDMLQGILSCSKEIQHTNKDCITYSKKLLKEVTIDNEQFFPTNSWFTAYSVRMAPMLYLPESVNWPQAVVIRSYVAQAIFRLIGAHVGISGTNLKTLRKNFPRVMERDSSMLDSLAFSLKDWSKNVRADELKFERKSVSLNSLVIRAYEHLVKEGLVRKETLDGARKWISAIEELNYNQVEELVSGKEKFEDENQILSQPLPLVGAVYMWDDFVEQSGLVHAIYQGVYKEIILAVDIQNKQDPKKNSPLPMKTTYLNASSGRGLLAYDAYLSIVDLMENEQKAHEDLLIWHHDDMLVNLTYLQKVVKSEKVYLTGLPDGRWAASSVKRVETAQNQTFKNSSHWVWTSGIQDSLKKLVDAEGYSFFQQKNTVCAQLNPIIKKQVNDTYMVWAHLFASQTDYLGARWKHPRIKDFNKNMKKMLEYGVFLEAGPSIAMRCTLTPEEVDQNLVAQDLKLITWWDSRRNDVPTMREFVKTNSFDMIHPNKVGVSEDNIRFALEFRALTSKGL